MGGAPLLLALAVVTADVGWEPDGRDGYRYIIQVPAEQLADVHRMGITSEIPAELRGRVTSVIIRVGEDTLPQPEVVAAEPRTTPSTADPQGDPDSQSSADSLAPLNNQAAADERGTDSAFAAEISVAQTAYPSPPDTVRAQGGSELSLPPIEEMREHTRRTAEELKTGVTDQMSQFASQTAEQARTALERGRHDALDATSRRLRETANQAVTAGTDAARNMMSSTAPSTDPARNGGTAANSYGRSNFGGFQLPADDGTNSAGGAGAYSPSAPSTSGGTTAANPTQSGLPTAQQGNDRGAAGGTNVGPSQPRNPATGIPSVDRPLDARASTPPSSSYPASDPPSFASNPSANSATPFGSTRSPANSTAGSSAAASSSPWTGPQSATTPGPAARPSLDEQQQLADERLLNDIGFQDNYAYDKKTGQWIEQNDPRLPQIEDYVKRQRAAEQERQRRDQLAAQQRASQPSAADLGYNIDYTNTGRSPNNTGWSDTQNNRYASTAGRPYGGNDAALGVPQNPAPPPQAVPPAQSGTGAGAANDRPTQNTVADTPARSPSDAVTDSPEPRRTKVSVEPQPFYNFLLLLSIVINVYLGIAITRLLRRYRNLVATHRGTAISV